MTGARASQAQGALELWLHPGLEELEARRPGSLEWFRRQALADAASGRTSTKRLVERYRAEFRPSVPTGAAVAVNNDLTRPLALWLLEQEPSLRGRIELRGTMAATRPTREVRRRGA